MAKYTAHTAHRACTPMIRSQVAKEVAHRTHQARMSLNKRQVATDTAHTCAPRTAEGRVTTNNIPWVGCTGATQPTDRASSRGGTPRLLVQAQPGCISDYCKRHAELWKQRVTGEPVHSPGGGRLPSREARQLKPQGCVDRTVDPREQYPLR